MSMEDLFEQQQDKNNENYFGFIAQIYDIHLNCLLFCQQICSTWHLDVFSYGYQIWVKVTFSYVKQLALLN